ncbi:T-complex protein 1 subunit beta [Apodemus speciosus]|uniref:T-complex protein 1 subunit beta n=1 Tax=Apodemus speciosus TaxID=105296 RepID=A0ABQ0F8J5_APOSI
MASLSLAPVNIFKAGADEERAETARLSSFIGAIAIGDLVKSTLGPKGMDKILLSSGRDASLMVTNDGATILKNIGVDNPAAKVLVDMSRVQDDEVGDGTTSVTVLAAELLRSRIFNCKKDTSTDHHRRLERSHKGRKEALLSSAVDHGSDEVRFWQDLMNIAGTTLSSKLLTHHKDHFTKLAVEAVLRLKGSGNLEAIHVIKKLGGSLADSYLDEGFLLDKKIGVNQPKRIENAKILIANTGMDTDKIKIFGSRVRVDSTAKVAEIEHAEKEKMKEKVERILKHGINCFINRQLIYNYPEQLFGAAGVMAIEHADFAGVERLALVTGGEIASTFDHPELVKLGSCKLIEEVMIGEDKLIHFSGVALGEACTIVLRGATQQILDEAERSLHDALCVLAQTVKDPRTVYGGGCSEMLMAHAVTKLASRTPGKEAVAMESFAKALRMLPTIIADNAGYDSADLVAQLRAAHSEGQITAGLESQRLGGSGGHIVLRAEPSGICVLYCDQFRGSPTDAVTADRLPDYMKEGTIGDMAILGITESFQVKRQVLLSAAEAAEVILRVDNIIKAAPSRNVSPITTPVKHSHLLLNSGPVHSKVVFERLQPLKKTVELPCPG